MDELKHECGIAAIYHFDSPTPSRLAPPSGPENVSRLMPRMLLDLQNRGQLAAGFTTYNPRRDKLLDTYKQVGTVIEAFRLNHQAKYDSIMKAYAGRAAIGHVRYATCGQNDRSYAQPFQRYHGCKWKWFSFAFNGQLSNFAELRDELLTLSDYHLSRNLDTEVILHYLSYELRNEHRPDLVQVFRNLSKRFDGAYNLVYMNAMGDMAVARDPKGFRPLCFALEWPLFAAASESVALTNLGFKEIRSLAPGEMIVIQDNQFRVERYAANQETSHCFFEWIYFANVASTLDERSVYLSRAALGKELAMQEHKLNRVPLDNDTIVVPVPDTGKAAADAMAYELGVPSVEGLMRNRYVGRTFIEGQNRADRVRVKYTPLREVLEGKRVLLIEDTIVRSTTLKSLLHHLRERGGAREVHVRVACPPIVAPCFYGIDMSTVSELFAPRFMKGSVPTVDEQQAMARELGADSLFYLPLDAVARCIGHPETRLCRACLTGEYPTEAGERLYQLALANRHSTNGDHRTYVAGSERGMKEEISAAVQDYLKAIHALGGAEQLVSPNDISSRLKVRAGSVTGMLKRLGKEGLIHYELRQGARLTENGLKHARRVIRRHRLVELFLTRVLGLDWSEVDAEAEALEHAISPRLEAALAAHLGEPVEDPHGHPIPTAQGALEKRNLKPLHEFDAGQTVVIREVQDDDSDRLRHWHNLGLTPGATVHFLTHSPLDDLFTIRIGERSFPMGSEGLAGLRGELIT